VKRLSEKDEGKGEKKKTEWKADPALTMEIKKGADWKSDDKLTMRLKEACEEKKKEKKE
jgi:hypothetical protein